MWLNNVHTYFFPNPSNGACVWLLSALHTSIYLSPPFPAHTGASSLYMVRSSALSVLNTLWKFCYASRLAPTATLTRFIIRS